MKLHKGDKVRVLPEARHQFEADQVALLLGKGQGNRLNRLCNEQSDEMAVVPGGCLAIGFDG